MNLPFTLPDWLPAWAFLLLAIPALLFVLAFLMMPFSVFGVKARLEAVEAQLATMTDELRNANYRRGVPAARDDGDDSEPFTLPNFGRQKQTPPTYQPPVYQGPPIPAPAPAPVAMTPMVQLRDKPGARAPQRPARRTEPRLD